MPHYKDRSNKLYFFSGEDVATGWPDRSPVPLEPISDADAQAMRDALVQAPTSEQLIKQQIIALESQITPRRIREALLSGDHSFIESIEAQIAALRSQLA